jgi:selenocysteine-specific elongation factor
MHVIATAGHVDHGKSTLIRALTGIDPDRLAEEKRRGLTIDLGFAWTSLGDQHVAFVDVPGHQRFVSTMLAGVGPVPAALFVVAADDGWRPQSAEHLDALEALGVRHGVLAVTRADLGDTASAEQQAREQLANTGLATVEAVAVDSIAGTGLEPLRHALSRMVDQLPATGLGPARLWIDRVFTVRGAGVVVTGTLPSGTVRVGDVLELRPTGRRVRVRGIESMKSALPEVSGTARVALNVRGMTASDARRGYALTSPGCWTDVDAVDVRFTKAGAVPRHVVLHLGSAAVPVRVRQFDDRHGRLVLATPLPVHRGDRGVLRDAAAGRVCTGAVVLDPLPPQLRLRGAAGVRATELSSIPDHRDLAEELRRRGAISKDDATRLGLAAPDELTRPPPAAVAVGAWLVDRGRWTEWGTALVRLADAWTADHPHQPGVPRRTAAASLDLPSESLVDALVAERTELVIDAEGVHRRGSVARAAKIDYVLQPVMQRLASDPFDAPKRDELAAMGVSEKYLALAVREGRLLEVDPGVYLHPDAVDQALRCLAELPQPFTVSAARQALGSSRRVVLPLLVALDAAHRTERIGTQLRRVVQPTAPT